MTTPPPDGSATPAEERLRRHEARVEARFQEVYARLVLQEGRFAAANDRLGQADRKLDVLAARADRHLQDLDHQANALHGRLDTLDRRADDWHRELIDRLNADRRATAHATLLCIATTIASTVALGLMALAST